MAERKVPCLLQDQSSLHPVDQIIFNKITWCLLKLLTLALNCRPNSKTSLTLFCNIRLAANSISITIAEAEANFIFERTAGIINIYTICFTFTEAAAFLNLSEIYIYRKMSRNKI